MQIEVRGLGSTALTQSPHSCILIYPLGGLAQLVRAHAWHAWGHWFDSSISHHYLGIRLISGESKAMGASWPFGYASDDKRFPDQLWFSLWSGMGPIVNRAPPPASSRKHFYGNDADLPVRVLRKARQEDSSWVFVPRKSIPINVSTLKPMVSNHRFIHDCPETENQLSTGSFLQSIHLFQKNFQYINCMSNYLTLYKKRN